MDAREQRGLVIAATSKLTQKGKVWKVPSQAGDGKSYTVSPDEQEPYCSCPDHESHGGKCKHIYAVLFVIQREFFPDGSEVVTQTISVTETIHRPTYKQDWTNYNAAQVNEKDHFLALLADLCKNIEEPEQKMGRPRVRLADAVFSACYKVYSTVSGRRFMCDLKDAQEKGYVTKAIHYNSIFKALENADLTPILKGLIVESSKPLAEIETTFAADSSAFAGCRFEKWFMYKHGQERQYRVWSKVQIMCGVKTNIITSAEVCERDGPDARYLPALARETAKTFNVQEICADKGYSSIENHEVIADLGAKPLIAFKKTATGRSGGIWAKCFHFFAFHRDEFLSRYHKRSQVEATFSMVKAKFRDSVRSKTKVAMANEVLCKLLCHNICCLISAMYELGVHPDLCPQSSTTAHKPLAV